MASALREFFRTIELVFGEEAIKAKKYSFIFVEFFAFVFFSYSSAINQPIFAHSGLAIAIIGGFGVAILFVWEEFPFLRTVIRQVF